MMDTGAMLMNFSYSWKAKNEIDLYIKSQNNSRSIRLKCDKNVIFEKNLNWNKEQPLFIMEEMDNLTTRKLKPLFSENSTNKAKKQSIKSEKIWIAYQSPSIGKAQNISKKKI